MEKIKIKSGAFVKSTNISINSFEKFLIEKHDTDLDSMIKEILELDDEQIFEHRKHATIKALKTI